MFGDRHLHGGPEECRCLWELSIWHVEFSSCGSPVDVATADDLLIGLYFAGRRSGENIWAKSIMDGYEYLGHTMLIAYGAMDMLYMHEHLGETIKVYLAEGGVISDCVERNNTVFRHDPMISGDFQDPNRRGCIKRKGYEEGIPVWKTFALNLWAHSLHPLGSRWTVSIENYPEWGGGANRYLGTLSLIATRVRFGMITNLVTPFRLLRSDGMHVDRNT